MKHLLIIIFTCSWLGCHAQSTTTYRDNLGRKTGTATTDSRGVTTYRDYLGRKTGMSTTDSFPPTHYAFSWGNSKINFTALYKEQVCAVIVVKNKKENR